MVVPAEVRVLKPAYIQAAQEHLGRAVLVVALEHQALLGRGPAVVVL
jgi:hypothetical protein